MIVEMVDLKIGFDLGLVEAYFDDVVVVAVVVAAAVLLIVIVILEVLGLIVAVLIEV